MPNQHKLGAYVANPHDPQRVKNYLSRLQPNFLRLLMPGDSPTQLVSDLWVAAGKPLFNPRWWDIDDGGEGNKHAKLENLDRAYTAALTDSETMHLRISAMEREAAQNGLPFPVRDQIILNALNEPPVWEDKRREIVRYNEAFGQSNWAFNFRTLYLELSVGQPAEWPPTWGWAEKVFEIIEATGGYLGLHEYWQPEGPFYEWTDEQGRNRKDWGALAGRYLQLPHDVPIIIGESGVDGRIYGRHATPDTGFAKFMPPLAFAGQLGMYLQQVKKDKRIVSVTPFITDFADKEWASFDTLPAIDAIMTMLGAMDASEEPSEGVDVFVPSLYGNGDSVVLEREHVEWLVERMEEVINSLRSEL